ncbi:MAG: GNAT family N-acetyltransferase [Clostridia bacterium]|nr:GNAT family N-acetyltransferase [Clostridia bacterium]
MNRQFCEVVFVPIFVKTPRLTIRRMTMKDAVDIFEYSRDERVARHVLWSAHTSIGESRSYIRSMIRRYRAGDAASYAIEFNSTGRVIGTIGFMCYKEEHNCVEIGYSLSRRYWNQGLMTEAVKAVIDYGFDKLNLHRIEAQHEIDNPASGAVMRKAGMKYEGRLRQRLMNKGKYVDVDLYAILSDDRRGD